MVQNRKWFWLKNYQHVREKKVELGFAGYLKRLFTINSGKKF